MIGLVRRARPVIRAEHFIKKGVGVFHLRLPNTSPPIGGAISGAGLGRIALQLGGQWLTLAELPNF